MESHPSTDLKNMIFRASRWSTLAELSAKVFLPLIFIGLAKILTPGDFGVVAASAILISFSQVIWDAGLSKALIQGTHDLRRAADVVFWTNIALALIVYTILYLSAEYAALIFHDPRIKDVVRIQGWQLLPAAGASVFTALYQKQLEFRIIFWIRLIATAFLGLSSLTFAFLGANYWSLVIGSIFGATVQFILLLFVSPWRPGLTYDLSVARRLFSFGAWISLSGLMSWFYLYVDSLVVGAFLSTHQLGIYQLGNNLTVMIFGILFSPFNQVLFSGLSRIQNDQHLLRKALEKAAKLMSLISLPTGLALFALRKPLATVVFNPQWTGVEEVIGIMGISWGIGWLVGAYPDAYRAIGRPDVETKIMLVSACFYLPVYLVAAPYGLTAFLWGRLLLSIPSMTIHLYTGRKVLSLDLKDFFLRLRSPALAAAVVFLAIAGTDALLPDPMSPLPRLALLSSLGAFSYGIVVWKLEKAYLRENMVLFLRPGAAKG